MRPKNFPGRKNQRRISALKRLIERGVKPFSSQDIEKARLEQRSVDQVAARAVRTKKRRALSK